MTFKQYTFTFASGATGTNKVYVGPNDKAFLVVSAMTNYNAGVGNATFQIRGGLSATDTHATLTSMTIATETVKGVYPLPYPGLHYMSVGFATAVTGSGANTIDVVIYDNV